MIPSPRVPRSGAGPSDRSSTAAVETLEREGDVLVISPQGDIVLLFEHSVTDAQQVHKFRVESRALTAHSKYFSSLLQGQFAESTQIGSVRTALREKYASFEKAPAEELPVLRIEDLGRISSVKSIVPLCTDFLRILHGLDIQALPPLANLANLAVVADRFDALGTTSAYVQRKKIMRAIDGKTTSKSDATLTEERVRQRVFVGLLLDYAPWVEKYSLRLIVKGWAREQPDEDAALWWDLPARVEDELVMRRDCILETIQSLQSYFTGLYLSRERQCKLGYDSSAQCDSFQLGEMIRFFTRVGTLQLRGIIADSAESSAAFMGDIHVLIDTLRQIPEYQIDRNHMHCGIRTKLMPLLDVVVESLQYTGICGDCWSQCRSEHAWLDAKRPLLWKRHSFRTKGLAHEEMHVSIRAMFTAAQRDWSTLGSTSFNVEK